MTETEKSGPHHKGRPTTFTGPQDASADGATQVVTGVTVGVTVRVAQALLVPAAGRRQFDVAVVTRCPWCLCGHVHRGADLHGAVRESGCRPGREYQLAVAS